MTTGTLKLGTRGSQLAMTQSGIVAESLTAATGVAVELVVIKTTGDRVTDRPLQQVGGKGLFTKEIEDALLAGDVDFAVHSMKDMPTDAPEGLIIAAVPERVDPRDALVGARLQDLAAGAVVGTGSVRRALQLRDLRPDLEIRGIRGNVDTRIAKQRAGDYDAILLAMAGLTRLGRAGDVSEALEPEQMIPAVGQGALAIQCRGGDARVIELLESIHHERTGLCVQAERAFLAAVSGGCSAPAACYAQFDDGMVHADGVWAADEDGEPKRMRLQADPLHVHAMGTELATRLMTP
ncbi:MAG: hydroxymethylbilane synthase [Myxococcales bacterium]|nr:hydroxymethylbilane synthase [Myxococcales bacterium]